MFPCSLPILPYVPMFPHILVHTFPTHFRTVIFRILFPCSQKLANVPLFPSIFGQCSLVPQNPWETLVPLSTERVLEPLEEDNNSDFGISSSRKERDLARGGGLRYEMDGDARRLA